MLKKKQKKDTNKTKMDSVESDLNVTQSGWRVYLSKHDQNSKDQNANLQNPCVNYTLSNQFMLQISEIIDQANKIKLRNGYL